MGPTCVYGGSCADPPAGEKYPGAWAESNLRRVLERNPHLTLDPATTIQAALQGPATPLAMGSALETVRMCNGILAAAHDAFKPRSR